MRRAALGLAALLALAAPALAADPAPTVLHLDQTAERVVTRDRLTVDLRAEATGGDPRVVQAEVNKRMTAALAKVKSAAGVKAASGSYSTYQATPSGPDGKPKPPAQWHASQELTLVSRDFPAALTLAGQLQADGLLIGDMRFDVAPETLRAQQQVLTDEALTALTSRAAQVAASLHLKVSGIKSLNVGNVTQPGGPRPFVMARVMAGAAPAPPPAATPGDSSISVTVTGEFTLVPGK